MSIPLLIIIGVLLVYIVVSYLYCHAMYLSKPKEAETVKKIKKLYYILTVIFAFIILSKFAFEQSIKDLSFDSSFIINNYIKPIIEKKTLTIEIILSFCVFVIFLFNVHFLPLLLSQSSKLTKNKFLSVYYNPKIIYNILPDNKVRNCIYSKVKQNQNECVVDLIDTFKSLYIAKKVYIDSSRNDNIEISKRVFDFEKDIINDSTDFVLLGDAGCGKSTLLFKTYIDIIEDNPKEKKIIPFFVDLKDVDSNSSLIEVIISKNVELFSKIANYKYFFANAKKETINKMFVNILKALAKDGYKFIFLLDSLDESARSSSFNKELDELFYNMKMCNVKDEDYKIVIAMRKSAFTKLKESITNLGTYLVYKVRDYDKSEIKLYIDKLIAQQKIAIEDVDDIYKNIDIVTFEEKVNPFIVSMIVNGYIKKFRRSNKTKVVEILEDNIKRLILDVNEERTSFDYRQSTYEIIGITTLFEKTEFSYKAEEYADFLNSNLAFKEYFSDLEILTNSTYLVDNKGHFYQKIFADFYGASYLLNTIKQKNNLYDERYTLMLDEILTSQSYQEMFEYLVLLTDNEEQDLSNSPLNSILDYAFNKYALTKDANLENIIYEKIKIMLKSLSKYTSKKIIKDKLPLEINATRNASEVTKWLYTKYFEFLVNNNLAIDYGYFYNIVSIVDKHDLAIKAVLKLNLDRKVSNTMLSIIRDSYMNLNYVDGSICIFNNFNFFDYEIEQIQSIITNNQPINKLKLRELLNLSFYNKYLLDYSEISINIDKLFFPTIYNLDLFIANYTGTKQKVSNRVCKADKLIYDSNIEYNAVKFIEVDLLVNDKIRLKDDVTTLYLHSNVVKEISGNISNTLNVRSIDIDEGIEVLQENCFNKSISLKNIILPNSLLSVEDFALYECHRLENLIIPSNVKTLGESFIEDCFNLKKVVLPSLLSSIGQYAFEDDTSLEVIDFNNAEVILKDGLFKGCMSLVDVNKLNLSLKTRVIPKQLFLECINLTSADLSVFTELESIGNYAFARCGSLEKIILPSSLKEVGMLVFYECDNLKEIVFNSLPKISRQTFANLNHEVKIVINYNDKVIEKVVNNNTKFVEFMKDHKCELTDDKFVNGIVFERKEDGTFILDYCFNNELKDFKVNEFIDLKISSCNIGALGNQELINDVIFDENLNELAEWLFEDCYSLYTVDLQNTNIKVLNKHIFENCYCLKEVLLPNTLTEILEYAFENCNELNRLTFASQTVIPNVLVIPENINSIHQFAFHNCNSFTRIEIKSNKTRINSFAFDGLDRLEEITLPNNYDINNIEDGAFVNCGSKTKQQIKVNGLAISKKDYERIFKSN